MAETRIPVSGTERARWSYASKVFRESGHLLACGGRSRMSSHVQCSLERSGAFHSNQDEVWEDIALLQAKARVPISSSALGDVFKAREDELRRCEEAFKSVPDQVGLLAIINGRPAGMELVSLKSSYARLHSKLVRSYAIEALLGPRPPAAVAQTGPRATVQPCRGDGDSGEAAGASLASRARKHAKQFLAQIMAAEERSFSSIGHGADFRYRLAAPPSHAIGSPIHSSLIGSALVHRDEVIHAAFFQLDGTNQRACRPPARNRQRRTTE